MILELTHEQGLELKSVLQAALGDLSYEIAATENPSYRSVLLLRRERMSDVVSALARNLDASDAAPSPPPAIYQEFSHPGG